MRRTRRDSRRRGTAFARRRTNRRSCWSTQTARGIRPRVGAARHAAVRRRRRSGAARRPRPSTRLMIWLATLDQRYGLAVESITVDRAAQPGTVNANVTFTPPSPLRPKAAARRRRRAYWPLIPIGVADRRRHADRRAARRPSLTHFLPPTSGSRELSGSIWHGVAGRSSSPAATPARSSGACTRSGLLLGARARTFTGSRLGISVDGPTRIDRAGPGGARIRGGGPIGDLARLGVTPGWSGVARWQPGEPACTDRRASWRGGRGSGRASRSRQSRAAPISAATARRSGRSDGGRRRPRRSRRRHRRPAAAARQVTIDQYGSSRRRSPARWPRARSPGGARRAWSRTSPRSAAATPRAACRSISNSRSESGSRAIPLAPRAHQREIQADTHRLRPETPREGRVALASAADSAPLHASGTPPRRRR